MAHKPIAISVIIPVTVVVAAILIVPWPAFQRSHAQSDIASTILDIHNRERTAVGSLPLTWSNSLAADAKGWADHLVQLNEGKSIDERTTLVHATGTGQGENLASRGAWGSGPVSPPSTESLLQGWVNEKPWRGSFDHYTQMVWKDTKEVGCATGPVNGKTSNGNSGVQVFLVCRYSPPGNMAGEKPF
jgi:pathogenesis-related protein 1